MNISPAGCVGSSVAGLPTDADRWATLKTPKKPAQNRVSRRFYSRFDPCRHWANNFSQPKTAGLNFRQMHLSAVGAIRVSDSRRCRLEAYNRYIYLSNIIRLPYFWCSASDARRHGDTWRRHSSGQSIFPNCLFRSVAFARVRSWAGPWSHSCGGAP